MFAAAVRRFVGLFGCLLAVVVGDDALDRGASFLRNRSLVSLSLPLSPASFWAAAFAFAAAAVEGFFLTKKLVSRSYYNSERKAVEVVVVVGFAEQVVWVEASSIPLKQVWWMKHVGAQQQQGMGSKGNNT